MPDIQSNRQLWGRDFPLGGEWDAGYTPPHTPLEQSGRWTVKREETRFVVVFHRFQDGREILLAERPPDEAGEIEAKTCATNARDTQQFIPYFQQGEDHVETI